MTSLTRQEARAAVRVVLDWPHKHLSPNARVNWRAKHRAVSSARHKAGWATVDAVPRGMFAGCEIVRVRTTFLPPDRRQRDEDNLRASCKAIYDGIADGIGVDDKHFRHAPVAIGEPVKGGLVIVELSAADTWEHISEPLARAFGVIPYPPRGAA